MNTLSSLILAGLLGVWLASAQTETEKQPEHSSSPFTITEIDYTESHFIQPGFFHGARDCGGIGRTLQFIHQGCVPSGLHTTCLFDSNKHAEPAIYFVPNEDVDDIVIRVKLNAGDGETKSFDVPLPGTTLSAGRPYKFSCSGIALPEFLGKVFTGRMELLRKSDSSVQVCTEIDMLPYSDKRSKNEI